MIRDHSADRLPGKEDTFESLRFRMVGCAIQDYMSCECHEVLYAGAAAFVDDGRGSRHRTTAYGNRTLRDGRLSVLMVGLSGAMTESADAGGRLDGAGRCGSGAVAL